MYKGIGFKYILNDVPMVDYNKYRHTANEDVVALIAIVIVVGIIAILSVLLLHNISKKKETEQEDEQRVEQENGYTSVNLAGNQGTYMDDTNRVESDVNDTTLS